MNWPFPFPILGPLLDTIRKQTSTEDDLTMQDDRISQSNYLLGLSSRFNSLGQNALDPKTSESQPLRMERKLDKIIELLSKLMERE